MDLDFGNGLTLNSQVRPLSGFVQGGDILSLDLHFGYNGTAGDFTGNSSACQALTQPTVFINLLIVFPLFLELVRPANFSRQITQDVSNCSLSILKPPLLNVSTSFHTNYTNTTHAIELEMSSSNVSWVVELPVNLTVRNLVPPDSVLNVTADLRVGSEIKTVLLASYRTPRPSNLRLTALSTSLVETPSLVVTSYEEVTFQASFELPVVTTGITLRVELPTFRNTTPMIFVSGSVLAIPLKIKTENLHKGSSPWLKVNPHTRVVFPSSKNIAEFAFGRVQFLENTPSGANHTIVVELSGMVDSSQGVYVPNSVGNISCVLHYMTPEGPQEVGPQILALQLGQPQLEYSLDVQELGKLYEGKDTVHVLFFIENPVHATEAAFNMSVSLSISSADVEVDQHSLQLCSNKSSPSNMQCENVTKFGDLVVSKSSVQLILKRLVC